MILLFALMYSLASVLLSMLSLGAKMRRINSPTARGNSVVQNDDDAPLTIGPDPEKIEFWRSKSDQEWIEYFAGGDCPLKMDKLWKSQIYILDQIRTEERKAEQKKKKYAKLSEEELARVNVRQGVYLTIEIFRGAGKSRVLMCYIARQLAEDPTIQAIVYCENNNKAVERVSWAKQIFDSERFKEVYGNILKYDNKNKLVSKRMGSIEASSKKGKKSAQGSHPPFIFLDDIWSETENGSPAEFENTRKWMGGLIDTSDGAKCWINLCTRKGDDDFYEYMSHDLKMWNVIRRPILLNDPDPSSYEFWTPTNQDLIKEARELLGDDFDESLYDEGMVERKRRIRVLDKVKFSKGEIYGKCPIPGRFPNGKFSLASVLLRREADPETFETEMQCNPIPAKGRLFDMDEIEYYNPNSLEQPPLIKRILKGGGKTLAFVDPAYGTSKASDFDAIVVITLIKSKYFVREVRFGQWNFRERSKNIIEIMEKWDLTKIFIENDFGQAARDGEFFKIYYPGLKIHIKEYLSRGKGKKYQHLYNQEFGSRLASKIGKIRSKMERLIQQNRFYVPEPSVIDQASAEGINKLLKQMRQFPQCTKYDIIDATAMGIDSLGTKKKSSGTIAKRVRAL